MPHRMWCCRQAFIEAELAKRLGRPAAKLDDSDPAVQRMRTEEALYSVPDQYKVGWCVLQEYY